MVGAAPGTGREAAPLIIGGIDPVQAVILAEDVSAAIHLWKSGPQSHKVGHGIISGVERVLDYGEAAEHVLPVLDAMVESRDDPAAPIRQEMAIVRSALLDEVAPDQPGIDRERQAREATSGQIAQGLSRVLARTVDAKHEHALDTPHIRAALHAGYLTGILSIDPRSLAELPGGEKRFKIPIIGAGVTFKHEELMAIAAPELLQALGFTQSDALMQGAKAHPEGWYRRTPGIKSRLRTTGGYIVSILDRLPNILHSAEDLRDELQLAQRIVSTATFTRHHLNWLKKEYSRVYLAGIPFDEYGKGKSRKEPDA